jgi:hypothetical protein
MPAAISPTLWPAVMTESVLPRLTPRIPAVRPSPWSAATSKDSYGNTNVYPADGGHLRDGMIFEEFGHFLFSRLGIFRCPIRLDIVRFDFLRLKLYALHESKHKVVG